MIEELEKMANLSIPKDLSSDEANKYLKDACVKYEIKCAPPETTTRLLDKVNILSYVYIILSFLKSIVKMCQDIMGLNFCSSGIYYADVVS